MKFVGTVLSLAFADGATGFATGCDDGGTTGSGGGGTSGPTTSGGMSTTGSPDTSSGTTDPSTTTGGMTTGVTTGGGGDGIACPDSYCAIGAYGGYGFVYSDKTDGGASSITQKGTSLCASGTAGAVVGTMYSTYWGAGIGVNLNQKKAAMSPIEPVQLTGSGVTIGISNPPSTEFRVIVDSAGVEYCAVLKGGSTTVVWSDFNLMCWDKAAAGAKPLAGAPNSKALKVQIITGDADRPFDYCISSIVFN